MPHRTFKAMILAAGLGERMRPLTDHTPKPLLMAAGKPLIVWQIERLRDAGFVDLVINLAHLGPQIEDFLADGSRFGVRIQYSHEPEPLETAGGIATALHLLGNAPFLVTNGDVYAEFDYGHLHPILAGMSGATSDLAHLVLVDNPAHHPEGDFVLNNGRIDTPATHASALFTFSGIGCYQPALFTGLTPGHKAKLAPLLRTAIQQSRVSGEHFSGRWEDVGTPARLTALQQELKERHAN